jgi:hypothetical protein
MLAERGLEVVGIDPSEDMLAEARAGGGRAEYRRGEAAATGLDDASVALVAVAQAFHWFDADSALAEFQRVLRPGGHAAAIWNLRAESPFMADYDAVLRRFSHEYSVVESWDESLARLRVHPRVEAPRELEAPNAQVFDLEGLRGRAWSSSYVRRGVSDHEGFDAALRAVFDAHARGGTIEFPYRTVALVFRVAGEPRARSPSYPPLRGRMLRIEGVSKRWRGGRLAVRDFSLDAPAGVLGLPSPGRPRGGSSSRAATWSSSRRRCGRASATCPRTSACTRT